VYGGKDLSKITCHTLYGEIAVIASTLFILCIVLARTADIIILERHWAYLYCKQSFIGKQQSPVFFGSRCYSVIDPRQANSHDSSCTKASSTRLIFHHRHITVLIIVRT